MEPLISVIVPVYQVEQYLDECVQSIRIHIRKISLGNSTYFLLLYCQIFSFSLQHTIRE